MQRINQYGLQFLVNKVKCSSLKYVKLPRDDEKDKTKT